MTHYLPRIVDSEIGSALRVSGALILEGPRAVGKTESARRVASSELRLDTADPRAALALTQPTTALPGATPRLLDEWQLVPSLWNEVRHEVDRRRDPGQFILCGSVIPDDSVLRHPGAGRFRRTIMRTLTLSETGESNSSVSLRSLLAAELPEVVQAETQFHEVIRRIVTGGWPGWYDHDESDSLARARSYVDDISAHEFVQVAGTRRDPRRLTSYLRAVAAVIAQPAGFAAISRRIEEVASAVIPAPAIPDLHRLAERLFIVEDQPAWSPKLRSRTTATQTPKRHLADPSLAAALLGAGSDRLLQEPETLGHLFEAQVIHDLRVYAQASGARGVFHYRDTKGRDELDAVVEAGDGAWLAVEVKLGANAIDEAAANLQRVTVKMARPPAALIVIVPSGIAHVRPDGVIVVPLTTLGP